jgi:diaminopimelate decarboxylase
MFIIDRYLKADSLPNLKVEGVDCHIGSQLTQSTPFLDALDRLLNLIAQLADKGIKIKHLDLGGGLGVRYDNETPPEPSEYATKVLERLGDSDLTLIMEPGRSIAANAGILVMRVEYLKPTEAKNFAIVDAAMNDLLRPSLYSAWQAIIPVVQPAADAVKAPYDLVGPICETGDFIGKDRDLSLKQGDLLAVRSAGAYGFAMSSNYNSRNRAAEIMVDGENSFLVRRRETFEQQIAGENILPA